MKDGISNLFVFREDLDKKMGKNFEFKDYETLMDLKYVFVCIFKK